MMDMIAKVATSLKNQETAMSYSMALTKKVMDTQEMAAEELLEMLPPSSGVGQYIDTYA